MAQLIALNAPRIIIYHEARLILRAYGPSFSERVRSWLFDQWMKLPRWTDPEWIRWKLTGKSEIYEEPEKELCLHCGAEKVEINSVRTRCPNCVEWPPEAIERLLETLRNLPCDQCDCINSDTRRLGCYCPCHD